MKQLPEEFLRRMRVLLETEEEYQSFLRSYEEKPARGIRLNLRKLADLPEAEREQIYETLTLEWGLTPLPEATGAVIQGKTYFREFYINEEILAEKGIRPGRHPYHEAGLYYMQEPSAMQVVMHLDIRPDSHVADLCASPGGKSSHAADFLRPEEGGYLLSNEFAGNRARTLSSNLERMGVDNAVILNEDTAVLRDHFPESFDRIIIDAPCSGEGMFRKDDTAISEWSPENVTLCIARQKEIVANGLRMLRPGGKLSYSTCTFEPGEDEEIASYILSLDPTLSLVFEKRIFPHRERGEGHYIAVFEKRAAAPSDNAGPRNTEPEAKINGDSAYAPGIEQDGSDTYRTKKEKKGKRGRGQKNGMAGPQRESVHVFRGVSYREVTEGDRVRLVPDFLPAVSGLHCLRSGVFYLRRDAKKEVPEHGFSHAAVSQSAFPTLSMEVTDPRVWRYLEGQEIEADSVELRFPAELPPEDFQKGSILVAVQGAPMGFGRFVRGRVKNDFPKGLRFI